MDLVEVDPVGSQPPQRILHRADDPAARVALPVGVLAHRVVELGGEDHVVAAAAGERLADDLLGLALPVDIGGVDEVDPGVQRGMDDPNRLVVIRVAPRAEHHRAEAELAHRDASAAEVAMLHSLLLSSRAAVAVRSPVSRRSEASRTSHPETSLDWSFEASKRKPARGGAAQTPATAKGSYVPHRVVVPAVAGSSPVAHPPPPIAFPPDVAAARSSEAKTMLGRRCRQPSTSSRSRARRASSSRRWRRSTAPGSSGTYRRTASWSRCDRRPTSRDWRRCRRSRRSFPTASSIRIRRRRRDLRLRRDRDRVDFGGRTSDRRGRHVRPDRAGAALHAAQREAVGQLAAGRARRARDPQVRGRQGPGRVELVAARAREVLRADRQAATGGRGWGRSSTRC